MKDKRVNFPLRLFSQDEYESLPVRKSQGGLKLANPVTDILLTWTAQEALKPPRKHLRN